MQLDEALGRGDGLRRLAVLVVRIGDLDLRLLREGDVARRLTAATAMVAGITCLAVG